MVKLFNLPERQRQVLHAIIRSIEDKGQSPTYEEIAEACKIQKAHVQDVLDALEKKGRIKRIAGAHRSIEVIE